MLSQAIVPGAAAIGAMYALQTYYYAGPFSYWLLTPIVPMAIGGFFEGLLSFLPKPDRSETHASNMISLGGALTGYMLQGSLVGSLIFSAVAGATSNAVEMALNY